MDPQYKNGSIEFRQGYAAGLIAGSKAVIAVLSEQLDEQLKELEEAIPSLIEEAAQINEEA